ncbi:MAG: hypothetical protein HZY76_04015 [Anaerolineae bacterium]|nr:MAG: hypothetical protein HZY76_04015 [Anaerolineae bacterium]
MALQRMTVETRAPLTVVVSPVTVANGLVVVSVTDAVFDAASDQIRQTLRAIVDGQGCRWLVLTCRPRSRSAVRKSTG